MDDASASSSRRARNPRGRIPMTESASPTESIDASSLDELRGRVETALAACEFGTGCPDRLAAAMRYALLAPGKRLRPLLVLMAGEACRGSDPTVFDEVMPGAVAVEMIHAYSLIHDDLPAMDDDDLRRGRPTVHIEFDEATAILAGDALQAEAFRHLSHQVEDPELALESIRILSNAAGAARLVGGQADDLQAENDPFARQARIANGQASSRPSPSCDASALEQLEFIHRRKTGALFSASLDLGAILCRASDESRRVLQNYAENIGLAFQVVDDLLDFTADTETLGKRTGKDANRGKLTYPGLMGIDAARNKAADLIERSKQDALLLGDSSQRLLWLADFILERTH